MLFCKFCNKSAFYIKTKENAGDIDLLCAECAGLSKEEHEAIKNEQ